MSRIPWLLAMVLLLTATPTLAGNPKVRLAPPEAPAWEQGQVPYTVDAAGVVLYCDGVNYHTEPAPNRVTVSGHWYHYLVTGVTTRHVFVPDLVWLLPDWFGPESGIGVWREVGAILTRDLARDTTLDVQLGVDPQATGEIQTLVPRAWSGAVSTHQLSFGLTKARF